jgi:DNA-binding CsgD family transcriptional regulator
MKEGSNDRLGFALCLESLGWMHATGDSCELAATFLGAADRLWEPMATSTRALEGLQRNRSRCETLVRERLSPKAFDQAYTDGRTRTLHETLALAEGIRRRRPQGGGDTTPDRRQTSTSPLTAREYEVASLVAEGFTNREIAEALVISRRTAETHVQQILMKLGVDSRTRIARWLHETGQR